MWGERRCESSRLLFRVVLLAALWILLVEGSSQAPLIGLATIALAVGASRLFGVAHHFQIRPLGAALFVPYFLWSSFAGGLDVAARALRGKAGLDPALVRLRLRLDSTGAAAVFMVDTINLLPGTVCAGFEDGELVVHVIDRRLPNHDRLRELEVRVAALFGAELTQRGDGGA